MRALTLPDDFEDLLVAFADAGVDFLLIGGWAMAAYGRPRGTEDIDVFVRATPENSDRTYRALAAFGAPVATHQIEPSTFATEGPAYRFGFKPLLAEVLTQISGVTYDVAAKGANVVSVQGRAIRIIGRDALIQNKRAAGRYKDLGDVEWLERNAVETRSG